MRAFTVPPLDQRALDVGPLWLMRALSQTERLRWQQIGLLLRLQEFGVDAHRAVFARWLCTSGRLSEEVRR